MEFSVPTGALIPIGPVGIPLPTGGRGRIGLIVPGGHRGQDVIGGTGGVVRQVVESVAVLAVRVELVVQPAAARAVRPSRTSTACIVIEVLQGLHDHHASGSIVSGMAGQPAATSERPALRDYFAVPDHETQFLTLVIIHIPLIFLNCTT